MIKKLGVNVDHVATVREARKANEPSPVFAASICELAGCDLITAHLREDRRHIKDDDIFLLKKIITTKFNLEMSCASEIVNIALNVAPEQITLVPEKRAEITTEGGLDVVKDMKNISKIVEKFNKKNIIVSLFIDPDKEQIQASYKTGATFIEIHTGAYANSKHENEILNEFKKIKEAVLFAKSLGLRVNAGHGLNYKNVQRIVQIDEIEELNIGHSIVSRAIYVGLDIAVKKMLELIRAGKESYL